MEIVPDGGQGPETKQNQEDSTRVIKELSVIDRQATQE